MRATRKTFSRLQGTSSALALSVRCGLLAPLLGVAIAPAQATDLYWDVNGAVAGSGGPTPNGTWSTSDTTLSVNSAGTVVVLPRTTTTADRLLFSAGTDATGAYTVTVNGTQNIGRLTFQEGTVSLTGGTINFGAVSGLVDGDATPDSISVRLSGTNGVRFSGGTVTLSGAAANTYTGTTQVGGFGLAQAGLILSAAGGNAVSGNLLLIGAGGNYVSGGTVILGAANQINDIATVQMSAGHYSGSSAFSLNGFSETLGGINLHKQGGGGSFVVFQNGAATDATVTLAGSGTYTTGSGDRTFSRFLRDGGTGRLNVVVALTGAGQQTFAGTDPTYTGTTTVTSGTLQLWNTSLWASNATLNGGTLELQQTSVGTGFLAGAASRTHANTIGGTGGTLRKTGNGAVILSGVNTYQGATSIQAGTLQAGSTSAFGNNSAMTLANTAGATLNLNGFSNSIGSLAGGGVAGGNVNLGAATLTTGGNNTSTSYGGVISGSGALVKTGNGTQTLTGTNTYTGATTVAAGTLRVNGSLTGSPVTANAGGTLGGIGTIGGPVTIASGATLDAGPMAGAVGTLTTGALALGAGSQLTYDLGQANIVGGPGNDLVQVNGNLTLGGSVNVNAPGSVFANTLLPGSYRLINYTGTLSGSTTIGSIPTGFGGSQIQTVVPGQVNLVAVQNGVPVQFWDGVDTTGNGVINGGTSAWNDATGNWTNVTGSINQSWVPGVGIFTGTAGVVTIAEPVSAMGLQFISDGYQVTSAGDPLTMVAQPDGSMPFIRVDPGATADISAPIEGTAGLMKADAGTLILSGTNTYTGGTVISGGTLQLGDGGTTGSIVGNIVDDGALVFDRSNTLSLGGVISGTGTVTQAGIGTTILTGANTYAGGTVISGGTLQVGNGGTTGSIVGSIVDDGALVFDRSDTLSLGGVISGTGTVTQAGIGTTILTGANTFAGGTFLDAGVLQAAADGNLGAATGGLTFNGGTLRLGAGFDLAATRAVTLNAPGGTIDTNGFDSTAAQDVSGTGALTKTGAGTLALTGANTYAGATTVAAGTLRVNGSLTGSPVTANAGGTLGGIGTIGGPVTIASGATLDAGPMAGAVGTLTTGALALGAGSQLTYDLGQANIVGGPGNDLVQVNGNLTLGGSVNVNAPGSVFANTLLPGSYRLINYTGTLSGSTTIGSIPTGFGGSQIQTVVPGQVNLVAVQNGVPVQFWDGVDTTGNGVINGGTSAWNDATGNWTNVTGSINQSWVPGVGIFTGTAGVVTIAEPVSAMGLQFISDGYQVTSAGDPLTMVAQPDGSMPFIRVDPGATADISAPIEGTAGLMKADAGTLILSGTNTYTGGTVISGGTLQLGDGGTTGSIVGNIVDDGALVFDRSNTLSLGGVISGTGTVTQAGIGTTILTGANTYAGGTVISGGTLQVASDSNLGAPTGGLTFAGGTLRTTASFATARDTTLGPAGGVFQVDANTVLTDSGVISGAGALTKTGAGTFALTGANAYTGATTVAAGTLRVNGSLAPASAVTANSGSTLGGSGTIGGIVTIASAATLDAGATAGTVGTLTLGGLTLNAGSRLAYDLGQANVVSSPTNDLVQVNGNLTLGGSVNVNAPGSSFADALLPGSYRLINYTGTRAGSMTVGSIPADFGASQIQTVIPGQVNLIAIQNGVPLQFWDGTDTTGNSAINGGTEAWNNASSNWTNPNGGINQSWIPGVGIFTGPAGVVTMTEPITAMGLQFVTGGYEVRGAELTMIARPDGSMPFVRVDAGATAEISAAIVGTDGLLKADAGTLILTGTNTYTGGTTIGAGILQLGDGETSGSITGDIVNAGALAFNRADSFTVAGAISGTGAVRQIGTGTTVLTGDSSYTGGTTIAAGTLQLGDGGTSGSIVGNVVADGTLAFNRSDTLGFDGVISGAGAVRQIGAGTTNLTGDSSAFTGVTSIEAGTLAVNGRLCGDVNVRSGGRLEGTGTVCDTNNFAGGAVAPGNSIGTITVAGDYTGAGGVLEIETELGGDASPTDRLVVTGDTSGSTDVQVVNLGGAGAQTVDGIKIVDVGGTSGGIFSLLGDYEFQGEQAVVGGAYAYRLRKSGIGTPADGDWYLRSTLVDSDDPDPPPLFQPGVPLYEAYAGVLQSFNQLGTLQQRVGNRSWTVEAQGADAVSQDVLAKPGIGAWARIEGAHGNIDPQASTSATAYDVSTWRLQTGLDMPLYEQESGSLIGGVAFHHGRISSDVASLFGDGSIDSTGNGLTGTLTWYGNTGFYVDGQAQVTWFDSDLVSDTAGATLAEGNDGLGYAFSVEAGQRIALPSNWSLTPQAQLAYSSVDFDDFADPFGATVSLQDGGSLIGRLGISADYEREWTDALGSTNRSHVYAIANLYYDFLDGSYVDVSGTDFASEVQSLWGGIGVGGSLDWADGKYSVYGEALTRTSLEDVGDNYTLSGTVGFRVTW